METLFRDIKCDGRRKTGTSSLNIVYFFILISLISCKTLPRLGDGLDLLKSIGKSIGKATDVLSVGDVAKVAAKAGTGAAKTLVKPPEKLAPRLHQLPVVPLPLASLPGSPGSLAGRFQPVRPPSYWRVVSTPGIRPIRVTTPYVMTASQRNFTRLGATGLKKVNNVGISGRANVMERVLKQLLKTPFILAQPPSVRQALTVGPLHQRWVSVYSLYGYPVGSPYYYGYYGGYSSAGGGSSDSQKSNKEKKKKQEKPVPKKDPAEAKLYLTQLQLLLQSLSTNFGLVHVHKNKLLFGNVVIPKNSAGVYTLEMLDGPGTIGITGAAIKRLKNSTLAINGKKGLNNVVLEPNLLKDMNIAVKGSRLRFGKSVLQLNGVENLFIGQEAISVANLKKANGGKLAKQIKTAIGNAQDQPLFRKVK